MGWGSVAYRTASSAWAEQKKMIEDADVKVEEHPPACDNCGSSEYQHHHGRLICSYCRSAP